MQTPAGKQPKRPRSVIVASMRLVVSESASDLIEERGGELYVWIKSTRCCGGSVATLATACDRPRQTVFHRVAGTERFDVYVPAGLNRLPDELHVEVQRFPRRIAAYWDGCAWVI